MLAAREAVRQLMDDLLGRSILVLLCHKRSRTFTVAQYGQCPKALASATLN